jgi:integrase
MTDRTPVRKTTKKSKQGRRDFGKVRQLPSGRWQATYRSPDGTSHNAPTTFESYDAADTWLAGVQTDQARGVWVRPDLNGGGVRFDAWAEDWLATRVKIGPKTRAGYEALLRNHINPALGHLALKDVRRATVLRFVTDMVTTGAKPGTVRNAHAVVSAVFRHAVEDGRLTRNPASRIELPHAARVEVVPLQPDEVEAVAQAVETRPGNPARERAEQHHPEWSLLVRFAAYTGLRAGEIAGLRVGRVDTMRGTVHVRETVVYLGGKYLERQPTKSRQHRTVPMPRGLTEALALHIADRADDPDALVFPDADGGPWHEVWWYDNVFTPALRRAGLPSRIRFHDLRHTYASRLLHQGESMLAVSRLLGHSTITVTERTYAHLFPDALDRMTERLDATFRQHTAEPVEVAQVHQIGRSASA